jgi:hypothetical protein
VADTGCGTGAVLASVLVAHPSGRGILFDQPHVVAAAGVVLRGAGVADGVRVVPGDFFTAVPAGADAYILTRILHDWPDEDAVRILRRIRAAMASDARLLLAAAGLKLVGATRATPTKHVLEAVPACISRQAPR